MTLVGPLGLSMPDAALETDIRTGITAVEKLLGEALQSPYPAVTEAICHLAQAGGKRFRPLLTLLCAQFGDPTAPGVVPAAAVMELTHLATLYHDDVMDEAQLRRGTQSANARWGNTAAILAGDVLFAKASGLLVTLGPEAVRIHSTTAERLVSGQLREAIGVVDHDSEIEHYRSVIADKTGSLIATSCRFGAMQAGADEMTIQKVTEFGENIGMAFQISDDLLDITGQAGQIGKSVGTDLREGVATLPILYARTSSEVADAHLVQLLSGDLSDPKSRHEALRLLQTHAALDQVRDDVRAYAAQARAAIKTLADIPARVAMEALCDEAVMRSQ